MSIIAACEHAGNTDDSSGIQAALNQLATLTSEQRAIALAARGEEGNSVLHAVVAEDALVGRRLHFSNH